MEVTLKFNKGRKEGRTLLELLEAYVRNNKTVEMTRPHTQADLKPEILENMRQNDKRGTKGLKKFDTVDELFDELGI